MRSTLLYLLFISVAATSSVLSAQQQPGAPIFISAAQLPSLLDSFSVDNTTKRIVLQNTGVRGSPHINFQLWLPAGFATGDRTKSWPTVFFLHGADEGEGGSHEFDRVSRHGLPHKIEERRPFNEKFVLVTPQCPLVNGSAALVWTEPEVIAALEALREAILASSRCDARRTFLTGLSHGGDGVWEFAHRHPAPARGAARQHAWAAIAPMGSMWPHADVPNAAAARSLRRMRIWVVHCKNDRAALIQLNARGQPRCLPIQFNMNKPAVLECGTGADAVVEALRAVPGGEELPALDYDRLDNCPDPRAPTDTSDGFSTDYPDFRHTAGHDAWTRKYASEAFVDWLDDGVAI